MIVWVEQSCINTITNPANAKAMIASLNTVINTLVAAAAAAALNANIKEYKVDDGVTKAQFEYADAGAIAAQIKALMAVQQLYLQMPGMNSRVTRLIDSKNMPNVGPFANFIPTLLTDES